MLGNEMLSEMLDELVERIQHSFQHLKTKFVFDRDRNASNINFQALDYPTWVVKASNITKSICFEHVG